MNNESIKQHEHDFDVHFGVVCEFLEQFVEINHQNVSEIQSLVAEHEIVNFELGNNFSHNAFIKNILNNFLYLVCGF